MKKLLAVFVAALCFLLFSTSVNAGWIKSEAEKARENITKAIELMEIGLEAPGVELVPISSEGDDRDSGSGQGDMTLVPIVTA